jgi:hypothetical protein
MNKETTDCTDFEDDAVFQMSMRGTKQSFYRTKMLVSMDMTYG